MQDKKLVLGFYVYDQHIYNNENISKTLSAAEKYFLQLLLYNYKIAFEKLDIYFEIDELWEKIKGKST